MKQERKEFINFNDDEFDEIIAFLKNKIDFDFASCSRFSLRVEKRGFIEIDSTTYAKPKRDEDEEVTIKSEIDGSTRTIKTSELCYDNDNQP